MPTMDKKYFIRNGKVIKRFDDTFSPQSTGYSPEYVSNIFFPEKQHKLSLGQKAYYLSADIGNMLNKLFSDLETAVRNLFSKNFKKRHAQRWIFASVSLFPLVAFVYLFTPPQLKVSNLKRYYAYTSKPMRIDEASSDVYIRDSRSQRINEVFKYYKCPLEGMGEVFVHEADKNNIPWWLVASVAFQESTCGKFTPKIDGQETYNAWGWAVYGDNKHGFENWARGVETVSAYMYQRFFSRGITDTCDIMKVYTPPSNGSWCKGVDYFGDIIQSYKSPNTAGIAEAKD